LPRHIGNAGRPGWCSVRNTRHARSATPALSPPQRSGGSRPVCADRWRPRRRTTPRDTSAGCCGARQHRLRQCNAWCAPVRTSAATSAASQAAQRCSRPDGQGATPTARARAASRRTPTSSACSSPFWVSPQRRRQSRCRRSPQRHALGRRRWGQRRRRQTGFQLARQCPSRRRRRGASDAVKSRPGLARGRWSQQTKRLCSAERATTTKPTRCQISASRATQRPAR